MDLEKPNATDRFMETMVEKLGAVARASTVFSEPIDREGITVIPVAKARWGFGGGVGHRKDEDGAGGGGGVQVTPVVSSRSKMARLSFGPSERCQCRC